jgi:hypothetical protein
MTLAPAAPLDLLLGQERGHDAYIGRVGLPGRRQNGRLHESMDGSFTGT